jgi:hypothetical protein
LTIQKYTSIKLFSVFEMIEPFYIQLRIKITEDNLFINPFRTGLF